MAKDVQSLEGLQDARCKMVDEVSRTLGSKFDAGLPRPWSYRDQNGPRKRAYRSRKKAGIVSCDSEEVNPFEYIDSGSQQGPTAGEDSGGREGGGSGSGKSPCKVPDEWVGSLTLAGYCCIERNSLQEYITSDALRTFPRQLAIQVIMGSFSREEK